MIISDALAAHRLHVSTPEYHAHDAISCSRFLAAGLYTADESQWTPLEFALPGDPPSGPALDFGTLVHAAVYEPDTLAGLYAVRPSKHGRSVPSNSIEYGEWALAHAGRIVISGDDLATIVGCTVAVCDALLPGGHLKSYADLEILSTEACYIVDEPITGQRIRIKPDRLRLNRDGVLICEDLKTTSKRCSPVEFGRSCRDFHYWRRAAFYRYALRLITTGQDAKCSMLVVEKSAPHNVALYEMISRIDEAEQQNTDALHALRKCSDSMDFTPSWMKGPYAI